MKNLTIKLSAIKNDKDLDLAFIEIERLLSISNRTKIQDDELNIISLLVSQYEEEHYKIDELDPVELLKELMEQRNWKSKDLADLIGNKSLASQILNKKRPFSLEIIQKLYKEFTIPYEVLIKGSNLYV